MLYKWKNVNIKRKRFRVWQTGDLTLCHFWLNWNQFFIGKYIRYHLFTTRHFWFLSYCSTVLVLIFHWLHSAISLADKTSNLWLAFLSEFFLTPRWNKNFPVEGRELFSCNCTKLNIWISAEKPLKWISALSFLCKLHFISFFTKAFCWDQQRYQMNHSKLFSTNIITVRVAFNWKLLEIYPTCCFVKNQNSE